MSESDLAWLRDNRALLEGMGEDLADIDQLESTLLDRQDAEDEETLALPRHAPAAPRHAVAVETAWNRKLSELRELGESVTQLEQRLHPPKVFRAQPQTTSKKMFRFSDDVRDAAHGRSGRSPDGRSDGRSDAHRTPMRGPAYAPAARRADSRQFGHDPLLAAMRLESPPRTERRRGPPAPRPPPTAPPAATSPRWVRALDPSTGYAYLYDTTTGDSKWEPYAEAPSVQHRRGRATDDGEDAGGENAQDPRHAFENKSDEESTEDKSDDDCCCPCFASKKSNYKAVEMR
mmetsp:Transcript_12229/g.42354  ORF Transcript_12229/g.42354 Transcript_12229/m.42354 type:complete len:289 (-) Transcript_12229:74-940(-)